MTSVKPAQHLKGAVRAAGTESIRELMLGERILRICKKPAPDRHWLDPMSATHEQVRSGTARFVALQPEILSTVDPTMVRPVRLEIQKHRFHGPRDTITYRTLGGMAARALGGTKWVRVDNPFEVEPATAARARATETEWPNGLDQTLDELSRTAASRAGFQYLLLLEDVGIRKFTSARAAGPKSQRQMVETARHLLKISILIVKYKEELLDRRIIDDEGFESGYVRSPSDEIRLGSFGDAALAEIVLDQRNWRDEEAVAVEAVRELSRRGRLEDLLRIHTARLVADPDLKLRIERGLKSN